MDNAETDLKLREKAIYLLSKKIARDRYWGGALVGALTYKYFFPLIISHSPTSLNYGVNIVALELIFLQIVVFTIGNLSIVLRSTLKGMIILSISFWAQPFFRNNYHLSYETILNLILWSNVAGLVYGGWRIASTGSLDFKNGFRYIANSQGMVALACGVASCEIILRVPSGELPHSAVEFLYGGLLFLFWTGLFYLPSRNPRQWNEPFDD